MLSHSLIVALASLIGLFDLDRAALAEQPPVTVQILAVFDYPDATTQTSPQSINERGDIIGFYNDATGATRGFIRFRNGNFSPPLIDPNDDGSFTQARGINSNRTACGYYSNTGLFHGFFLSGNTYMTFDVPGATNTVISGINDAGDFVGEFTTATTPFVAYSDIGGTIATINVSGATSSTAFAININNEIVGEYADSGSVLHGFYQASNGALTFPLDPPGATATFPFGINSRSMIVGRFVDSSSVAHGFLLKLPNRYTQYDYPGAVFTSLNGVNTEGFVCGRYDDGSGILHGFVGRVR
jgi:hypothetical protein